MIEDSNCCHGSESSRVVDKEDISIGHDDVVSEFILGYYFGDNLRTKL